MLPQSAPATRGTECNSNNLDGASSSRYSVARRPCGPLAARAQQPAMPVIGYLGAQSPAAFASRVRAFRQGLGETGYAEGRNVAIEFRWAEGQHSKLPALAADLAAHKVAVIVAPGGAPAALAAKSATTTIPIVFEMGADPIAIGLVGSLSRPGGNLTGVSSLNVQVTPKRLEILHELIPTAAVVAVLVNPTSPTTEFTIEKPAGGGEHPGGPAPCSACQC